VPARTIDVVAARGASIAEARVPVTVASDHRPVVADLEPA
jgi:endonuclease/exonuclease/phosphatase (EEP) superfamily protein YafD